MIHLVNELTSTPARLHLRRKRGRAAQPGRAF
jgi:hypothetical protein